MSRSVLIFVLVLIGSFGSGCAGSLGSFDTMGFVHGEYPYTVEYRNEAKQTFITNAWRLDNFYGPPGELTPKEGDEYRSTVRFDADGDGTYDTSRKVFIYDLSFDHVKRDQSIFLRTMPIDRDDARKDLDVIMRDYISAISGAGFAVVNLSDKPVKVEKRFATKIVGQKAFKLADRDALIVVIDVSNVDQHAVNSQDSDRRVALLFVRTGYQHLVSWRNSKFPVVMVVGYASHADTFDEGVPAYEYFTSRIMLRDGETRRRPSTSADVENEASIAEVRALPAKPLALTRGTVAALVAPASPAPAPAQPVDPP